jgi:hypothetical protein
MAAYRINRNSLRYIIWVLAWGLFLVTSTAMAKNRWDQGIFVGVGVPSGGAFTACLSPNGKSVYGSREPIDLTWDGKSWIESKGQTTTATWDIRIDKGGVRHTRRTDTTGVARVPIPFELFKIYLAKQPVLHCQDWLPGPSNDFLRQVDTSPPLVAKAVTAGAGVSCAVLVDHTLRCWGDVGSTGIGSDNGTSVGTTPLKDIRSIALTARACALQNSGEVACWGGGTGAFGAAYSVVTDARAKAIAISLGTQLCAILADGSVACSAVGPGKFAQIAAVPQIKHAVSVSAGPNWRSCAATQIGKVYCWGRLAPPPVLNESWDSVPSTFAVIPGIDHAIQAASGRVQDCALASTGVISCWSYGKNGRPSYPETLPLEHIAALSVGDSFSCALDLAGKIYCWGEPYTSRRGAASAIRQVSDINDATSISVSADHGCALVRNGSVRCWGENGFGQLGSINCRITTRPDCQNNLIAHVVFGFGSGQKQ